MKINYSTPKLDLQNCILNKSTKKQCQVYNYKTCSDQVFFGGLVLQKAKNKKEAAQLAKIFFRSLNNNLPNSNFIVDIFEYLSQQIISLPFLHSVKNPNRITELVYHNNKISGGYKLGIDKKNSLGHIECMAICDELKHTKKGIAALKLMAEKIGKTASENKLEYISWETEISNTQARKLFKRLNAYKEENYNCISPYIKYTIPTDKFIEAIKKLTPNQLT